MAAKQIRPIRVEGQLAYVQLTQGRVATIDVADVEKVAAFNWYASRVVGSDNAYAVRMERCVKTGRQLQVHMHRVLVSAPQGYEVDHIDGDGLNNRSGNLRIASHAQNMLNLRRSKKNTSGVHGVGWDPSVGKWRARIGLGGKNFHVGYFATADDAKRARDIKREELYAPLWRDQAPTLRHKP